MNLFFVRISVEFKRDCTKTRARIRPSRVTAIAAGVLGLVATMMALPAAASTSGSNTATVQLVPPAVRSITVSPATAVFNHCSPNATALAFPNGACQVGLQDATTGAITGGITITNGSVAGHIDVNGQNATPSDVGGTPWTLLTTPSTPGINQFIEETFGSSLVNSNGSLVAPTPLCDGAFTLAGTPPNQTGDCSASANQSANEALLLEGPSSSTDQNGPFTITTTWTAVP
jgi:hypothetical protein